MVDGALRLLEAAPPRMRGTARLALRALERSSIPSFSRLSPRRRTRRIERLERSGSMLARNLVLLLKSLCGISYARAARTTRFTRTRCTPCSVLRMSPIRSRSLSELNFVFSIRATRLPSSDARMAAE